MLYPNEKGQTLLTCLICKPKENDTTWPVNSMGRRAAVTVHAFLGIFTRNDSDHMMYICKRCGVERVWG